MAQVKLSATLLVHVFYERGKFSTQENGKTNVENLNVGENKVDPFGMERHNMSDWPEDTVWWRRNYFICRICLQIIKWSQYGYVNGYVRRAARLYEMRICRRCAENLNTKHYPYSSNQYWKGQSGLH